MNFTLQSWQLNAIDRQLLDLALTEDLGMPYHDVTANILFSEKKTERARAKIISKHPVSIVVSGVPIVTAALQKISADCRLIQTVQDGALLMPGETLMLIEGSASALMMVERTLLNFLQHLSAIATYTAQFVVQTIGTDLKILDTRKTLPGFRHLEKYAVLCGGGVNHRLGLYDALMIKDTHIDILGGIHQALARLPQNIIQKYPVIIEVRTLAELMVVLKEGREKISRVLLDNMSLEQMYDCVQHCVGKMATEASGNLNLDSIRAVAETGVQFASIGCLTHSAGNVDLSMTCHL